MGTMKRRSMRAVLGTVSLAAAVVAGVGATPVGGQAVDCATQPYTPQFGYSIAPSQPNSARKQFYPSEPKELPAFGDYAGRLAGQDLAYPGSEDLDVDTDGDGAPDQIDVSGSPLVITRGDGVITITSGADVRPVRLEPLDLDGDGRDEIVLITGTGFFVLPGTTGPGTYAVEAAGIAIPSSPYLAVGDQVDGAGDDLVVPAAGALVLTSGNSIMAAGAGGSVLAFVPASGPLPDGEPTALRLDDGPPQIAFFTGGDAPGALTTITLWDGGDLTTYRTPTEGRYNSIEAIDTGSARYLVASSNTRSGTAAYAWDLDDPCAVLPAAVTTTTSSVASTTAGSGTRPTGGTNTATGATPVRGTSRFTG